MSKKHIEESVRSSLEGYFRDLRGTEPTDMHDMMVRVVEKPLLEVVMRRQTITSPRPRNGWGLTATHFAKNSWNINFYEYTNERSQVRAPLRFR